jgi:threonine synthase
VGWAGLKRYLGEAESHRELVAISLETAHPAKFPEELTAITQAEPPTPPSLKGLDERAENYREIDVDYGEFKNFLLKEMGS